MSRTHKLQFAMVAKESGVPVAFKQDGQRFEQPHTVKLTAGTDYELRFTLKPVIHIDKLMVNGDIHKLNVQNHSAHVGDSLSYVTDFTTTGYEVTQSGKRKEILIVFELENGAYMKVTLQCKVYKLGDSDHAQWGQKLNALECVFEQTLGQNYVRILKVKYL